MGKNILITFLIALILVLLLFGYQSFKAKKSVLQDMQSLSLINEELSFELDKTRNEKNELITKTEPIVIKNQEVINSITENKDIDELTAQVKVQTVTKYDTIKVFARDTILVIKGDTTKVKLFDYEDNWLSLSGKITNNTLTIDSLLSKEKFTIELGKEKKHWFSRSKQIAYIKSDNPKTDVSSFKPVVLDENKKWYEKGSVKFLSGVILTLIIVSQI
jgi:hypothetical protein